MKKPAEASETGCRSNPLDLEPQEGLEPSTTRLQGGRSTKLSYGGMWGVAHARVKGDLRFSCRHYPARIGQLFSAPCNFTNNCWLQTVANRRRLELFPEMLSEHLANLRNTEPR